MVTPILFSIQKLLRYKLQQCFQIENNVVFGTKWRVLIIFDVIGEVAVKCKPIKNIKLIINIASSKK